MNPVELPLRDIHLPADVSGWPPALGWWLLLILLLMVLTLLVRAWYKRRRTPVYRKQIVQPALHELTRIEQDCAGDPAEMIRQLSVLLRRSAMSLHGRQRTAGLTGAAWLAFLDQQHNQPVFAGRFGKVLTEQPYREQVSGDAKALLNTVRSWLQQQENARNV